MNTHRILIAGCGALGIQLSQQYRNPDWEYWGLRRNASELPAGLHPWSADLLEPSSLAPIPFCPTHVIYTATPNTRDETSYRKTYVTGLQNILDALHEQKCQLQRIILISSTSVYGQSQGEWVDESSEAQPTRQTGEILLEGESLLRNSGFPFTIVRFGGIYGPHRSLSLLNRLKRGEVHLTDGAPHYTNRIHQDDCVGVMRHLLRHPSPPSLLLGVDHDPVSRNEMSIWLAKQLGQTLPSIPSQMRTSSRRSGSKRCKNRLLLDLGYHFLYPSYKDGYNEIINSLNLS